ncbi:MAG: PilZ domain-containing protein [Leptospiraceae bacterium]|nr:PilZ domain-containing protein [Leptospiraceae bacterium]MCK6381461.1 PilZ domain-containing protein [Leptospiraceae bacterium]NUM40176.1 PilZ domain-containing protein [Leptospiraceae bacterium]
MSILKQNLPVQIVPIEDNEEGLKYQGILENLEAQYIQIKMGEDFFRFNSSDSIQVEFTMGNYNFRFDSQVLMKANPIIQVKKPSTIHKKQIRKSHRLKTDQRISFTMWTEGGRYEATMTDLSTVGIKMISEKQLQKNTLISLNVFFPGESLRFICQGLVMWCRTTQESDLFFESGVKFTTLSIETMKKVDRYIKEKIHLNKS